MTVLMLQFDFLHIFIPRGYTVPTRTHERLREFSLPSNPQLHQRPLWQNGELFRRKWDLAHITSLFGVFLTLKTRRSYTVPPWVILLDSPPHTFMYGWYSFGMYTSFGMYLLLLLRSLKKISLFGSKVNRVHATTPWEFYYL